MQEARALLQRWFDGMQSGAVQKWQPDPTYPVKIDAAVCDQIVEHIEREMQRELTGWANLEAAGSYDAPSGFDRLAPPQRLALAQQLHALKVKHKVRAEGPTGYG